jgi:hypothetical protein
VASDIQILQFEAVSESTYKTMSGCIVIQPMDVNMLDIVTAFKGIRHGVAVTGNIQDEGLQLGAVLANKANIATCIGPVHGPALIA